MLIVTTAVEGVEDVPYRGLAWVFVPNISPFRVTVRIITFLNHLESILKVRYNRAHEDHVDSG